VLAGLAQRDQHGHAPRLRHRRPHLQAAACNKRRRPPPVSVCVGKGRASDSHPAAPPDPSRRLVCVGKGRVLAGRGRCKDAIRTGTHARGTHATRTHLQVFHQQAAGPGGLLQHAAVGRGAQQLQESRYRAVREGGIGRGAPQLPRRLFVSVQGAMARATRADRLHHPIGQCVVVQFECLTCTTASTPPASTT
jgi:hypothetical protein